MKLFGKMLWVGLTFGTIVGEVIVWNKYLKHFFWDPSIAYTDMAWLHPITLGLFITVALGMIGICIDILSEYPKSEVKVSVYKTREKNYGNNGFIRI